MPPPAPPGQAPPPRQPKAQAQPRGTAVLVKRKPTVEAGAFKSILEAQGLAGSEGLSAPGWWRVPVPAGESVDHLLGRLRQLSFIEAAEEDGVVTALFQPNDPYFPIYQWGAQKINAPSAWDITQGDRSTWIAVVDSGIDYTHPDRPASFLLGYDYVNNDSDPWDDKGHGTHVAGIAAAATNNSTGIAGLCPDCEVLAVKVLGADGQGTVSGVAQGIHYAAYWGNYYGKRTIINLSLGGGYSQAIADEVTYAQNLGDLVIASSGNSGPGGPGYPAALSGVVAVSATTPWDTPATYSQYGAIAAPGGALYGLPSDDVLSTVPQWYATPPYTWSAGTSMASPHVAGAAGLVWSRFPSCSANQVANEIYSTVDVPSGWNSNYGYGRLNINNAMLRFTTTTLPPGTVGTSYTTPVTAWGGTGTKTYSVSLGPLPPGLSLSPSGGLYGAPTQSGSFGFFLHVADNICEGTDRWFSVSVQLSAPTVTPLADQLYLPLVVSVYH